MINYLEIVKNPLRSEHKKNVLFWELEFIREKFLVRMWWQESFKNWFLDPKKPKFLEIPLFSMYFRFSIQMELLEAIFALILMELISIDAI